MRADVLGVGMAVFRVIGSPPPGDRPRHGTRRRDQPVSADDDHSSLPTALSGIGRTSSATGGGLSRGSGSARSSSTAAANDGGPEIFGAFGVHGVRFCTT